MLRSTYIVKDGHNARLGLFILNELTNDGIVKVINALPRDALLNVLLLKEKEP